MVVADRPCLLAEHRYQEQGDDQGGEQRDHDRQPQVTKRLSRDALDEDHREEHGDRGEGRGGDRHAHFGGSPRAAERRVSPSSRQREMDSRTTMEESTNMPMPSARPPSDMIFNEIPMHVERREGHEQGDRNADGDDDRRSQPLEEQEQHENREQVHRRSRYFEPRPPKRR